MSTQKKNNLYSSAVNKSYTIFKPSQNMIQLSNKSTFHSLSDTLIKNKILKNSNNNQYNNLKNPIKQSQEYGIKPQTGTNQYQNLQISYLSEFFFRELQIKFDATQICFSNIDLKKIKNDYLMIIAPLIFELEVKGQQSKSKYNEGFRKLFNSLKPVQQNHLKKLLFQYNLF